MIFVFSRYYYVPRNLIRVLVVFREGFVWKINNCIEKGNNKKCLKHLFFIVNHVNMVSNDLDFVRYTMNGKYI